MCIHVDLTKVPDSHLRGLRIPDELEALEVLHDLLVLEQQFTDGVSEEIHTTVGVEISQEHVSDDVPRFGEIDLAHQNRWRHRILAET